MNNTFFTAKDVANILKISKALAYRLLSEGQIASIRFGKTVRVSKQALEAFIQEKETGQHETLLVPPAITDRNK